MEESLASTLTGWRRHLHRHPELSRSEHGTAAFVAARLAELGVPHQTGIGGAGVVGTLTRGASNRCVGLRADMDALPIIEATGLAYASANHGVMPAAMTGTRRRCWARLPCWPPTQIGRALSNSCSSPPRRAKAARWR